MASPSRLFTEMPPRSARCGMPVKRALAAARMGRKNSVRRNSAMDACPSSEVRRVKSFTSAKRCASGCSLEALQDRPGARAQPVQPPRLPLGVGAALGLLAGAADEGPARRREEPLQRQVAGAGAGGLGVGAPRRLAPDSHRLARRAAIEGRQGARQPVHGQAGLAAQAPAAGEARRELEARPLVGQSAASAPGAV